MAGNAQRNVIALFEPEAEREATVILSFLSGSTNLAEVFLTGTGGDPFSKAHTLHPVISGERVFTAPVHVGGAEVKLPHALILLR